jgi:hypothetical protein
MDLLFGDATSAMPTPATQAERGSLMGYGSPEPSLDLRRQYGPFSPENAIPGLDIDPPDISPDNNSRTGRSEGIGGWISSMVSRNKDLVKKGDSSHYRRLDQEEE